jgi:hypothetical protein
MPSYYRMKNKGYDNIYVCRRQKQRTGMHAQRILILLLMCAAFLPQECMAGPGFWASSKLTLGYDQAHISTQFKFAELEPPKIQVVAGYTFKLHANMDLIGAYIIQLPAKNRFVENILGLDLKVRLP